MEEKENFKVTEIATNDGYTLFELSDKNSYIQDPSRKFLNAHFSEIELDNKAHSYLVRNNFTGEFENFI